jgi:type II secretory pathway component PulM
MNARVAWLAAWRRRAPRERALIALAAVAVLGAAAYALLYRPLAADLDAMDRATAQARADVAVARRQADDIAGLARERRTAQTPDLRAATARVAAAAGLKDALTALEVTDGRVRVTFADVGLAAFADFVDAAGREELLFPTDVLFAARVAPGQVRAEATLARPQAAR